MITLRSAALLALCGAGACGGGAPPAKAPPKGTLPLIPATHLVGATVYDSSGRAAHCATPQENCPATPSDTAFFDRCRLAGFQVRRCGCDSYCSGKVAAHNTGYSADGSAKPCAPAQADCTPPDTSAAFQDACTDAGHRLEVCGCEWLCSGPPKR